MQPASTTVAEPSGLFAPTHWSIVLAAGATQTDPDSSQAALAQLCETYWPPLYSYARARGYSLHDAEDLTQGFFVNLIERKIYARTAREKGKFRSFLLAAFNNFLSHARDRERTLKRGGRHDFVPLDEGKAEAAEALFQTHSCLGHVPFPAERLYERSWADALITGALRRLAAAYQAEGKGQLFQELQSFVAIGATPPPTYIELTTRLGMAESTLRSHVTRLRARYREILRTEVRQTVSSNAEVDGELRELLRVLTDT